MRAERRSDALRELGIERRKRTGTVAGADRAVIRVFVVRCSRP